MPRKKSNNTKPKTKVSQSTKKREKSNSENDGSSNLEYVCNLFFRHNPVKNKQEYVFSLETIKLFSSLNYEITIEAKKRKTDINLKILGLRSVDNYLMQVKPASGEAVFEDIYGKHKINIYKQDGSVNSAVVDFNVFKKEIKIIREDYKTVENAEKFCLFNVAADKNTFTKEGIL